MKLVIHSPNFRRGGGGDWKYILLLPINGGKLWIYSNRKRDWGIGGGLMIPPPLRVTGAGNEREVSLLDIEGLGKCFPRFPKSISRGGIRCSIFFSSLFYVHIYSGLIVLALTEYFEYLASSRWTEVAIFISETSIFYLELYKCLKKIRDFMAF